MVSVIIPAYNYGRFLTETLNSVQNQTEQDFECIVVDNGSTDNTAEVVQPFLSDPRFRYLKQENLGVSAARNTGLQLAKGEYIQFLDADDLLETEKLRLMRNYLEQHSECDLVYSDMRYFKTERPSEFFYRMNCDPSHDLPWMNYESAQGAKLAELFLAGNNMVISSPLFRKVLISSNGLMDENLRYNEDWEFWLRLIINGARFDFLKEDQIYSLIRVHKNSASVDHFKMQVAGYRVLRKHAKGFAELGLAHEINVRVLEHLNMIKTSLLTTKGGNLFKERLNILKQADLYNLFFGRNTQSVIFAKLLLRFRRFS